MMLFLTAFLCPGPFHTTLEKFENGIFTLKTQEMFSVHTRRNLKTQQSPAAEMPGCNLEVMG